jgi:hypothetical protein
MKWCLDFHKKSSPKFLSFKKEIDLASNPQGRHSNLETPTKNLEGQPLRKKAVSGVFDLKKEALFAKS